MGDHGDAVDAQENGPAELTPIGAAADRPELGTDQEPTERRERVALYRVTHALEDELGGAFRGLDQDVAAEAVGDHDIGLSFEDVLALDVADEIDAWQRPKQGFASLNQLVALAGFLPIAEERHPWRLEAHQLLGIDAPHQRVLDEVLRLGIGVGADIEEEAVFSASGRDNRADRRPVDAGDAVQAEERRRHDRSAVPRAHEAAGPAVLDHLDAADDGRRLLAANRLRRMFVHGDHLGRILDLGPFPGARRGERGVHLLLDADEDHLDAQLAMRLDAAGHHLFGGEITAHGVKRDFHETRPAEGRLDVQVAHGLGVRLDEAFAWIHFGAHQDVEDLVGLDRVFDLDPQQHAVLRIHGGLPELLGIHLTETLVARNLRLTGHLRQLAVLLLIGVGVADLLAARDLVQRRLGNVEVLPGDHLRHVAEEKCEQQGADVRTINVSISHYQYVVISQFPNIKFLADARAECRDEIANLL